MGAYVNPPGMTNEDDKVAFLIEHGRKVSREEASKFTKFDSDELPVVCCNNGFFLALGIAINQREVNDMTSLTDCRPREYFMVPKSVLYPNSNLENYLPLNNQKGFTLIELFIVFCIIGILAAVAIPAYMNYLSQDKVGEVIKLNVGGQRVHITLKYPYTYQEVVESVDLIKDKGVAPTPTQPGITPAAPADYGGSLTPQL